jgi:hypothetical protein
MRAAPAATDLGAPAEWIELPPPSPGARTAIEDRVLLALAAAGRPSFFAENWLWRTLFGLAFWDVVFADVPGAFVHPFQAAPLDLEEPSFRPRRAARIAERLREIAARDDLAAWLLPVWECHRATSNRLVVGEEWARPHLALALETLHGWQLAAVCDRLAHHLGRFALGLPDLYALPGPEVRRGQLSLLEVKGPGDQLRPEQRGWLRYLAAAGIPAGVLRVAWSTAGTAGQGG